MHILMEQTMTFFKNLPAGGKPAAWTSPRPQHDAWVGSLLPSKGAPETRDVSIPRLPVVSPKPCQPSCRPRLAQRT